MLRALVAVLLLLAGPAAAVTYVPSPTITDTLAFNHQGATWTYVNLPSQNEIYGTLLGWQVDVDYDMTLVASRVLQTTGAIDLSGQFGQVYFSPTTLNLFLAAPSMIPDGVLFASTHTTASKSAFIGVNSGIQLFYQAGNTAPPNYFQPAWLMHGDVTLEITITSVYDETVTPVPAVPLPASGLLLLPVLAAGLLRRRR